VEAGEINVLPLNPMNTLPHLPRGMERYLKPAVSRMEIGTLVVAARQTYFEMPFSQYRFHPQWYWNEILGTFRVRSFGPAIDSNPSPATVSKGTERIIYDVYVLEERLKENATLEDRVEVILQQIKEDYDFFAAYEYLEELLVEGSEGESGRLGFWSSFIEDHSESAYGRVFLSRALWRAGRYDEALAEAGKAWDRKPDDDAILSNYGNMLVNSGNCADGWEKLGQLVQRPEGNYFNVLSKRLELIRASESCFDDTEYMKLIEEWLELGPDTPQQYIVKLTDYKVKESEL
jgi:tetratricopeptide (TPR) repeat protein